MKKVFIFPGLNALLRKGDRARYLDRLSVQKYLTQAEQIIGDHFSQKVLFSEFLNQPTEVIYHVNNISVAAVAICAIQTAVAEDLAEQTGEPDWVMGCSLGDLARTVYARGYSFEDAVTNHISFTQKIDGIDKIGKNIGVLAPRDNIFTAEDYQWFSDIAVDVSCLTPRFLNIGGRFEDLVKVEQRAVERSWNVMTILEYPAHSRYIRPYVDAVASDFTKVVTQSPRIPMFSSLSAQPISDPTVIREEFLLSITRPIHWCQAAEKIHHEYNVTEFINIGPCRSLTGMMKDIPITIQMREAWEMLGQAGPVASVSP
jgi:[acyl-carrier-protein] S-malonyltransferase